jgi:putative effector of murein hydrolase LrgA (UPF0299 family)
MSKRSWSLPGAVAGAVAIPALLAIPVFLIHVIAGGTDADLLVVVLPVLLIPAAVVGAVFGARIVAKRDKSS